MNSSDFVSFTDDSNLSCKAIRIDVEAAQALMYTDLQIAMMRYVLPVVFVFGVFNNAAFIYVVTHTKNMQTTTNKCLLHLSIADLLFLIVGVGEKVWGYLYSPITPDDSAYGPIGCSTFKLARSTAYFASLAFITVVSVERAYAVCRYQKKRDAKAYRNIIIGCWLASFTLSLTFIPSVGTSMCSIIIWPDVPPFSDIKVTLWTICLPVSNWTTKYTDAVQTIPFVVLLVINLCLYYCIIAGLNAAIKRAHLTGKRLRNTEIRNQIAYMLIANGIIFFALLSPHEVYFLMKNLRDTGLALTTSSKNFSEITSVLSYINSSINPVVYSILSSKHRKAFQDTFCPERCLKNSAKNRNCPGYLHPSSLGHPDETSMGYRHSPRLGIKMDKTTVTELQTL